MSLSKTSFNETYDIVCHLDRELYEKIPATFIRFLQKNMAENHVVHIDYSKSIQEQDLERGTRVLLSLIYKDYLASPQEKERLSKEDALTLQRIEEEKRQKYDPKKLFQHTEETTDETQMTVFQKENRFQKILRKIRNFFRK